MLVIAQPYDENRNYRDADDYAIQWICMFPLTIATDTYEGSKTMHVGNTTQPTQSNTLRWNSREEIPALVK